MRGVQQREGASVGAQDLRGEYAGTGEVAVEGGHFAPAEERVHDKDLVGAVVGGEYPLPLRVHPHKAGNVDFQHQRPVY